MSYPQEIAQSSLQLLMERAVVRQLFICPNLLQVRQELLQGRKGRLGDEDSFFFHWTRFKTLKEISF